MGHINTWCVLMMDNILGESISTMKLCYRLVGK